MRSSSCLMAAGCHWMKDCLKPAQLWPDIVLPDQASLWRWASASVSGSTSSSSRHCPAMGFWSRMCLICIMDVEPKIAVLADEDIEEDPDRWCSYPASG